MNYYKTDYQFIKKSTGRNDDIIRETYNLYNNLRKKGSAKLENDVYMLAYELNIPNEACGKVHVNLIQNRFPDYQIIVLINDLDIFHKGP